MKYVVKETCKFFRGAIEILAKRNPTLRKVSRNLGRLRDEFPILCPLLLRAAGLEKS